MRALAAPSTTVRTLFDHLRAGVAEEIETSLADYIGGYRATEFVDFDRCERSEVQAARVVVIRQGTTILTDRLLLLGVPETPPSYTSVPSPASSAPSTAGAEILGRFRGKWD